MSRPVYLRGGRILDPARGRDETGDLFLRDGRVAELPASPPPEAELVEAKGLVVAPGLIDLHAHFREPGSEDSETIDSGSHAAARGGFTTVVIMPNTKPPLDTPERVARVRRRSEEIGLTTVLPAACVTLGRAGHELTDIPHLIEAGARAFTDDGSTVATAELLVRALKAAWEFGAVVMDHAQDHEMEQNGVMHLGAFSKRWGLPGIPAAAESSIVERDVAAAEKAHCPIHIQHVSARGSVELIRAARGRGVNVSGELTPHHLALTDADVVPDNASFKMNPPLRSAADREALVEAIADGTLAAFATDHAPHTQAAKAQGFHRAPFGIVGLETAVGITFTELVQKGLMDVSAWLARWTTGPARILGLPEPTLEPGAAADVVLLDLRSEWTVRAADFCSLSRNTPFEGRRLKGRAVRTLRGGTTVWPGV